MSDTPTAPAPKRSTWEALSVFLEKRSLVMLMLGFSAGLPNLLLYDTISAWMRQAKLPLDVITLFSLLRLLVSFRFSHFVTYSFRSDQNFRPASRAASANA